VSVDLGSQTGYRHGIDRACGVREGVLGVLARNESAERVDFPGLLRVALGNGWIVVLLVALGASGAYFWARSHTKVYSASTIVRVFDPNDPDASTVTGATGAGPRVDPAREVQIAVLYARSSGVSASVDRVLGDHARLVRSRSVSGSAHSDTIKIVVHSGRPEVARDAAQAYAQVFVDQRRAAIAVRYDDQIAQVERTRRDVNSQIDALDTRIAAEQPSPPFVMVGGVPVAIPESVQLRNLDSRRAALVASASALNTKQSDLDLARSARQNDLDVVQASALPRDPISPSPGPDAAIGGGVGLLLGLGLVGLRMRLRDRVTTSADLAKVLPSLSFIAAIPPRWSSVVEQRLRRGPRFDVVDGRSSLREAYRALRTSVLYGDPKLTGGSLLVTSASPGEGKTTIAANLSVSLARGGARVVVVDCDLRHPALHQQFGIDAAVGLSSVLTASTPVRRAVRTVEAGGTCVDVLLAGPRLTDPADLLVRPEVAELLEQLKAEYDHVVLDGPAVLPSADALALARVADGVLLVVQSGETKASVLAHVDVRMRRVAAHVAGAALVGVRADRWPSTGSAALPGARARPGGTDAEIIGLPGTGGEPSDSGDVLVL
ncbi:MAG: tyrosine-protein kinase, partial [Actinomycetota bacterium]|nr:tyrosine-protein kinase [Actinomycetota bacterium]